MSKEASGLEEDMPTQFFVLREIVEETIEKNKEVHMAFVDLENAYDIVRKEKLWMVLERYGVEGKLLRAIQAQYDGGMACVKVGQSESETFHVCKGVKQVSTLRIFAVI